MKMLMTLYIGEPLTKYWYAQKLLTEWLLHLSFWGKLATLHWCLETDWLMAFPIICR